MGFYRNFNIGKEENRWIETNSQSFEFVLESKKRFEKEMKFEIKDTSKGYIKRNDNDNQRRLITIGDISLWKQPNEMLCSIHENSSHFDYKG